MPSPWINLLCVAWTLVVFGIGYVFGWTRRDKEERGDG